MATQPLLEIKVTDDRPDLEIPQSFQDLRERLETLSAFQEKKINFNLFYCYLEKIDELFPEYLTLEKSVNPEFADEKIYCMVIVITPQKCQENFDWQIEGVDIKYFHSGNIKKIFYEMNDAFWLAFKYLSEMDPELDPEDLLRMSPHFKYNPHFIKEKYLARPYGIKTIDVEKKRKSEEESCQFVLTTHQQLLTPELIEKICEEINLHFSS